MNTPGVTAENGDGPAHPKTCPKCGLLNPGAAQSCDCGHDFQTEVAVNTLDIGKDLGRDLRILLVSGGVFVAMFILFVSVIAIQGMSGRETIVNLVVFFSISFAIAFAIGGASAVSLTRKYKLWPATRAFAGGGAIGSMFLGISIKALVVFSHGPLGSLLLSAIFTALTVAFLVGIALLKRVKTN